MVCLGPEQNRSSASFCNKLIMFITDGVEGGYAGKKIFEKRNKNKDVRAFAFLVGRKKSPDEKALKEMVCSNRGYFYKIETLGNVWDTVLKYLSVLSRPMAVESEQQLPTYSPVYSDSAGLGMVVSASLGVFGTNKLKYKELVGVAGTDILLANLEEAISPSKLGVFSHSFAINNNGFILFHPKFKDQIGHLPAPPNVYLQDVERTIYQNDSELLQIAMIDRNASSMQLQVYWLYDNNRRLVETTATYFYDSINNTEFSTAIAVFENDRKYYEIPTTDNNKVWILKGIQALDAPVINTTINYTSTNFTYVQVSPWTYCKDIVPAAINDNPRSVKSYPTAAEIYDELKDITDTKDIKKSLHKKCDSLLINKLLCTAGIVDERSLETWTPNIVNKDIESVFVFTNGGYSKYFTYNNISLPFKRDVFKTEIFEQATAAPANTKIILSAPYRASTDTSSDKPVFITVSAVIKLNGTMLSAG